VTPKQEERIRTKIKRIKAELAADKKRWGGYHDDSRGLRYLPTSLYILLGDYSGGLRFTKWFYKNFPDDSGFPDFLFECTIILFKTNKLKDAQKKAFETFCSNNNLFEKFFGRPIHPVDNSTYTMMGVPSNCENLVYSSEQEKLSVFSNWLTKYLASDKFLRLSTKFMELNLRLSKEKEIKKRGSLIRQARDLEDEA